MGPQEQARGAGGGGRGTFGRLLRLPLRYPLTALWAVLMVVFKSGVLAGAPAVLAGVSALAAPLMIPAYIVGFAWLGVGQRLFGFDARVPLWFEVVGVLIVAGAYVLVDRVLWSFRSLAARERLEPRRRP